MGTDAATRKPIGIIGLGAIGGGVAAALERAGLETVGYDVRPEAIDALGAVASAPTPGAVAARADTVLIAVMDDAQLEATLNGSAGVLSEPTRAVVVLSTVTLDTIRRADEACRRHGVALIDCGVSGGPHALEQCAITAMVGGDDAAVAAVRPILETFADPVLHVGPTGSGMRAKLARNLVFYTDLMVAWEGARLAEAAGVSVDDFLELVRASERHARPHLHLLEQGIGIGGAPAQAGERIARYAVKDLTAALALGAELGIELPAASAALRLFPEVAGLEEVPSDG